MEIIKLSTKDYKSIFTDPYHVFNKLDFNLLNAEARGIEILCLGFKTKKYKLGLIGGIVDKKLRSPFSAPFGGFSYSKEDISLETIDEALGLLLEYCRANLITEVELTLPPLFYEMSFISKLGNALYRKQFIVSRSDLNYSIHLDGSLEDYLKTIHHNAKKNLNIALTKAFSFFECKKIEDKELAYDIIRRNREAKGYPLRMSYEAVQNTINVINADFFLVKLEQEAIAAAMIFHVTTGIIQVVYWGDLPEYSMNRTMNYLSYSIINHYQDSSIKIIDIGPSTENSIPNYGLCDFKESIGCRIYPKYSYIKVLN